MVGRHAEPNAWHDARASTPRFVSARLTRAPGKNRAWPKTNKKHKKLPLELFLIGEKM